MKALKIGIVDDHSLFREGLRFLLEHLENVSEVHEAENGSTCLSLLESWHPDIIFMDIEMPGLSGIETSRQIKEKYPDIRIVALSMYAEQDYYSSMIEAGAHGFILKNSRFNEIKKAIEEVHQGHHYFSPVILDTMIENMHQADHKPHKTDNTLSKRETEILKQICKGLSNAEIANNLCISKRTVDKHRENILLKTGNKNTAGLVMFAVKNNIVRI